MFKQEGLYCTWSPYWAKEGFIEVGKEWGLDGIEGVPVGALFWDKNYKKHLNMAQRSTPRPNPYCPDKTPLIDDPALAIFKSKMKTAYYSGLLNVSKDANYSASKKFIIPGARKMGSKAHLHLRSNYGALKKPTKTKRQDSILR